MAKPKFLYDNRLADATITASGTAVGEFAAANLTDFRPYTWWKPDALPATLTVDCGAAKAADYALVYGHDLGTQGATLEVRGSTDNFVASDVLVATVTPTSDAPILLTFASASYRYWRIRLTGSTAPSLAIVSVGTALEMPTWLPQGFDPLARKVVGQANRNANGHPLGKVIDFEEWAQSLRFQRITWSWLRSTWAPAWKAHLRSQPFGFAWDHDSDAVDVKLLAADGDYSTPHYAGSTADLVVGVTGVAA